MVETLLFYHPAVWWLSHRIRVERENCCDDLAVSLCGDPGGLCCRAGGTRGAASSNRHLALAASGGSLLRRVKRLLGARRTPVARRAGSPPGRGDGPRGCPRAP